MTNPSAQDTTALTQAILENAQRLGLKWTLMPGTIVEVTVGSAQIMVLIDGDSVAIGAHSLMGLLNVGTRVMVMTVPPSGNYIIGFYGDVSTRRALVSATAYEASGQAISTTVTIVTGCDVSVTLTKPSIVRASIYGLILESVTGISFIAVYLFLDGVQQYFAEGTVRVAGDRLMLTNSEPFALDAGTYQFNMRVGRSAAAGTQDLIATQSRLIIDIYE